MRGRTFAVALLVGLACGAAGSSSGADPGAAGTPVQNPTLPGGIAIGREGGTERLLAQDELAALPSVQATMPVEAGHGPSQRSYEGPLLWMVLVRAGVVDAARVRDEVREAVLVTGRDGYTAVLALGEISPAFEDKQVILADRMDGKPLGPDHLRIVIPGDRRGGRSVRDIARITVITPR